MHVQLNEFFYFCLMVNTIDLSEFEDALGPWMGTTVKLIEYHLQGAFEEAGIPLTKEQLIVLKMLHQKDGRNQIELAILTSRNKSSLTRLLAKMEKKKFVKRKSCCDDKRAKLVYLTEEGKHVFRKALPIARIINRKIQQGLHDKEKETFIQIIKKIQTNLGENASHL